MGRAVKLNADRNGCKPEFLTTEDTTHDWPWTVAVHHFTDWEDRPKAYVRPQR